MFTTDKPICKSEDDLLNRENFSKHLANALLNSKETENLVVALCGKWGSGKSSIINLAKEHIEKIEIENKPTIINFNPWHFSGLNNLIHYFFDEIAKELELKQTGKQASKIAESLKFYGEILSVVSEAKPATDLVKDILLYSSIASFAIPEIMSWLGLSIEQLKKIGLIIGIGFTFTAIAKNFIFRLSNLYSQKAELNKISTDKLKEKISKELKEINNKIIIVIDDIDRLTKDEIRQLFQLIKINADFPNVIYLLAFDREIVEHNLCEQDGYSGRDYLEKIVQVFFDIPYVTPAQIHKVLYDELDKIDELSNCHDLFDQDYWQKINDSVKSLFKNIRDVRRFINSLNFNIKMLNNKDRKEVDLIEEVNPIDFIAIEAIRLFIPNLYDFIKNNKALFIDDIKLVEVDDLTEKRKYLLNEELNKLPTELKEKICGLIKILFPKIKSLLDDEIYEIDDEIYTQQQRVCSKYYFDCYFSFLPGGDEDGISQYDLEKVFNSMQSVEQFTKEIKEYEDNSKIDGLLELIEKNATKLEKIPVNNVENIIKVFVNFADDDLVSKDPYGFNSSTTYYNILSKLLTRQSDNKKNYKSLISFIENTNNIYVIVSVFDELDKNNTNILEKISNPTSYFKDLMDKCIKKIKNCKKEWLPNNKQLIFILSSLQRWDKDYQDFISSIIEDNTLFWLLMEGFISSTKEETKKYFNAINLNNLIDSEQIRYITNKVNQAKQDNKIYDQHREVIDLFLAKND